MNTTLYLIRHGEVDNPKKIIYGRLEIPLTIQGYKQMEDLGGRLLQQGAVPDVIYSSTLTRAVQSARAMNEIYGGKIPLFTNPDLQDTNSPGLEGRTLEWLKSIGGDVYNCKELKDLDIEKPDEIVARMMQTVLEIRKQNEGKTVFVVSHGDPTAFLLWRLRHPVGDLPSIALLAKESYLKKGEAWKVVLDESHHVVEYMLIAKESQGIRGKREY